MKFPGWSGIRLSAPALATRPVKAETDQFALGRQGPCLLQELLRLLGPPKPQQHDPRSVQQARIPRPQLPGRGVGLRRGVPVGRLLVERAEHPQRIHGRPEVEALANFAHRCRLLSQLGETLTDLHVQRRAVATDPAQAVDSLTHARQAVTLARGAQHDVPLAELGHEID